MWAIVLIRRIDGKIEPSFGYRSCVVRDTVAGLLAACGVAGTAMSSYPTLNDAMDILIEARKLWH